MKLMVLDGNSILNRAYYGIRPLSTREGLYTHAVYGFITTLQRLLDEENPEALCVTFDRREPTFRHRADAEYKAQRKPMPPELAMQLPVMKQVLSAMSVPCLRGRGTPAAPSSAPSAANARRRGGAAASYPGARAAGS